MTERTKGAFSVDLHTEDWCHICGKKKQYLLDIDYPDNAEYPKEGLRRNIRMCSNCINGLKILKDQEIDKDKKKEKGMKKFLNYDQRKELKNILIEWKKNDCIVTPPSQVKKVVELSLILINECNEIKSMFNKVNDEVYGWNILLCRQKECQENIYKIISGKD